jgi:hypothetical protein
MRDDAIVVCLTPDELYQAAIVAVHRRVTCLFHRQTAQHYDAEEGDEWATEIESCCAEMVLAKHQNRYWSGGVFNGKRAAFDVDGRQARHTAYANGHLVIYPEDKPEDKFVLVTGKAPRYFIQGWLLGREAMSKGTAHEWWLKPEHKRAPSWWVPQSALRRVPACEAIAMLPSREELQRHEQELREGRQLRKLGIPTGSPAEEEERRRQLERLDEILSRDNPNA